MPRNRLKGAEKPVTCSGAMRLSSWLPQMAQCAEKRSAKGAGRLRKRVAQLEHRQGRLPIRAAAKSMKVRLRDRRQAGAWQAGQIIKDVPLSDLGLWR